MITNVTVENGVVKAYIHSGGCITRELNTTKAVELTCLANPYDCVNKDVANKLLQIRSMIDTDIVEKYFRGTRY